MNTTRTTVRRAAATAALVGAAVLAAAPAHAAPAPEDTNSSSPSKALIEHRESEQRVPDGQRAAQAAQQQAYLDGLGQAARQDSAAARAARAAFAAQQQSYAEHMAQAARGSQPDAARAESASSTTPRGTDDGVSVLTAALLLVGGIAIGTGATGYTAYRFRHHGPVGAATA